MDKSERKPLFTLQDFSNGSSFNNSLDGDITPINELTFRV